MGNWSSWRAESKKPSRTVLRLEYQCIQDGSTPSNCMKGQAQKRHVLRFSFENQSTKNWYWERRDSDLRRKPPTDLQSVAFNHSATLPPFPGTPLNLFLKNQDIPAPTTIHSSERGPPMLDLGGSMLVIPVGPPFNKEIISCWLIIIYVMLRI